MKFTENQLEALKAAALPIDYGSITIQIGATSHYLDIDVHHKIRVKEEPTEQNEKNRQKNT